LALSSSSLNVKNIRQSSRSQDENNVPFRVRMQSFLIEKRQLSWKNQCGQIQAITTLCQFQCGVAGISSALVLVVCTRVAGATSSEDFLVLV